MQNMTDWEKQTSSKAFKDFNVQRWWKKTEYTIEEICRQSSSVVYSLSTRLSTKKLPIHKGSEGIVDKVTINFTKLCFFIILIV